MNLLALSFSVIIRREISFSLRIEHQVIAQSWNCYFLRLDSTQLLRDVEEDTANLLDLLSILGFILVSFFDLFEETFFICGGLGRTVFIHALDKLEALSHLITFIDLTERLNNLVLNRVRTAP